MDRACREGGGLAVAGAGDTYAHHCTGGAVGGSRVLGQRRRFGGQVAPGHRLWASDQPGDHPTVGGPAARGDPGGPVAGHGGAQGAGLQGQPELATVL